MGPVRMQHFCMQKIVRARGSLKLLCTIGKVHVCIMSGSTTGQRKMLTVLAHRTFGCPQLHEGSYQKLHCPRPCTTRFVSVLSTQMGLRLLRSPLFPGLPTGECNACGHTQFVPLHACKTNLPLTRHVLTSLHHPAISAA